ncbi:MAG: metal-dependent transcriptional regulator [Deltaproteobacteria bacterium]|nr:metal-dependent transcriptional regulator [Deltaproteobacteria bacterium]
MDSELTHSAQDYLEAIFLLADRQGLTRVKEVADRLDVKKPSVVSAIKALQKKGLVVHQHYGCLELTSEGEELAKDIHRRHQVLFRFLHHILGVKAETAETDACRLEHHISPQTLALLIKFVEFTETYPERDKTPKWLDSFQRFAATGEAPPCLDRASGECRCK